MDFAIARRNMVESQLRTNKVTDEDLLSAMRELPRELFVPAQNRSLAYIDEDIPVINSRFMMEPMVLARLFQTLQVQQQDSVLVVGSGTGYSAAVASRLAASVFALESDATLLSQANQILTDMAIDNVVAVDGALSEGYASQAPYNVILVDGAVETLPQALLDQLAEGGRLAAVVIDEEGIGRAMLYWKQRGIISHRPLFDANVKLLPGFEKKKGFVF